MKKFIALNLLGASVMLAPFFSANAVTMGDSSASQPYAPNSAQNNSANAQLLYQMQQMQEELMRTRGMLEEQQQQIQELKQQRLEDYKNIDKRLSEMSQQRTVAPVESVAEPTASPSVAAEASVAVAPAAVSSAASQQDMLDYQKAYDLIKQRKFDQARDAFLAFNKRYPNSDFVPNAHYWLGELYIIEGNYVKAKASFQTIIKQYPTHTKYPEALYKIATVNYELGDRTTAKLQLDQLISKYGSQKINAVTKAREFIKANYP